MHQLPVETGEPAGDLRAFRRCLGQFATGVSVVSADVEGVLVGMTANSFASVSLEPPLVLWSVDCSSASAERFVHARHFAINVLARDQIELSRKFGRPADDKFHGVSWAPGLGGAPIIADIAASFECTQQQTIDGGDHVIIIGKVQKFSRFDREGLLFAQGRYALAREHTGSKNALESDDSLSELVRMNTALMPLVTRVQRRLRRTFDHAREGHGVSRDESAVLGGLAAYSGVTVDHLTELLFLGANTVSSTVSELAASKNLKVAADGKITLTQTGRALREALLDCYVDLETKELTGIPRDHIRITEAVLATLLKEPADRDI